MRLSTNTIYTMGTQAILEQQSRVAKIGQQLASERRIVNPSDDPNAATQALVVSQASAVTQQHADNRSTARRHLSTEESQLDTITNALQAAKPLLVQAANGTLSDADRDSVATQLQGVYDQLLSSANARDGNGRYIFSGFATDTQPFSGSQGNVSYQGDTGQRKLQVDGSQAMAINDPGSAVFDAVTASARYVGTANSANTGSASFSGLNITDGSAADNGDTFTLSFTNSGSQITYDVVDQTSGQTVASNQPFTPGQAIALGNSLSVTIKGTPDDGDNFTFAKGRTQDNNILNTLASTISQLRQPLNDDSATAALTNKLNGASVQLDNSLDNVLSVRATLGARLNELDTMDTSGANELINYKSNLSSLQDLDMVSAISRYSLAKVSLQAAQQTFTAVQRMSLFGLG